MNELSLFAGAGGGLLGTRLLGWRTIGYVEINDYCQRILTQRIRDGILDEAPIFGNICSFISEGYASSYQGMVDVITAGFPCQPFSVAGKQQGENDPRNMWPQTIECIRIIRPQFALMENVPGLLAHPYARRIFGDMAESGYDAQWRVLSAAEVGAPHKRDRLWIVAYNTKQRDRSISILSKEEWRSCSGIDINGSGENVGYSVSGGCGGESWGRPRAESADGHIQLEKGQQHGLTGSGEAISHSKSQQARGVQQRELSSDTGASSDRAGQAFEWPVEPNVGRVAHGVANRVDRLKAIGNGQVPRVVATAWRLLNE